MGIAVTFSFCDLPVVLDPKEFGNRLLGIREARGVKQEQLARLISHTQSYISQLERGEIERPSSSVVCALEDALLVRRGYLSDPTDVIVAQRAAVGRLVERYGKDLRITNDDADDLRLRWAILIPSRDPPLDYWIHALEIIRARRADGQDRDTGAAANNNRRGEDENSV